MAIYFFADGGRNPVWEETVQIEVDDSIEFVTIEVCDLLLCSLSVDVLDNEVPQHTASPNRFGTRTSSLKMTSLACQY
jgi:hypothetical protein